VYPAPQAGPPPQPFHLPSHPHAPDQHAPYPPIGGPPFGYPQQANVLAPPPGVHPPIASPVVHPPPQVPDDMGSPHFPHMEESPQDPPASVEVKKSTGRGKKKAKVDAGAESQVKPKRGKTAGSAKKKKRGVETLEADNDLTLETEATNNGGTSQAGGSGSGKIRKVKLTHQGM
ncbi:hypothetical protein BDV93DRAFT_565568, partial [Ceratobasidium sp. AG-I]